MGSIGSGVASARTSPSAEHDSVSETERYKRERILMTYPVLGDFQSFPRRCRMCSQVVLLVTLPLILAGGAFAADGASFVSYTGVPSSMTVG